MEYRKCEISVYVNENVSVFAWSVTALDTGAHLQFAVPRKMS